jgi:rhodanese-related sulfurtransferase
MEEQIRHYQDKLAFEIDSWDVHAARKAGENLIVLDVRPEASFEAERIADAVSLPHRLMLPENVAHLDRSAQYVTYCDGIGCNASTAGAMKMARLGFKVKELIGGIAWWRDHGYPLASGVALQGENVAASATACGCD